MEKLFVFIGLLISTFAFACKCDSFGAIGLQFHNSDFVGEIEILKVYGQNNQERTYKVDVRTDKIYKGKSIQTIDVLGLPDDVNSAACEMDLKVGDRYLIYISKNEGDHIISYSSDKQSGVSDSGNYLVSACTPKTLIFGTNHKKLDLERQVNAFLTQNKSHLSQASFLDESVDENSPGDFKNFKIVNPKNYFAVLKLKVNGKSKIDKIEVIQNFGSEQDYQILKTIKKNFIISKEMWTEVRNEEVLLTLFYVPENENQNYKETISLILE